MHKLYENMIIIGKIGKPYGILGWLYLISFTEIKTNIFHYFPWTIQNSILILKKKDIISWKIHAKKIIIKIININNRNLANDIQKKNILIERKNLPKLSNNNYYYHEIIKCKVYNSKKKYLGIIDKIIENPIYNTIKIVNNVNKNIYIPFILNKFIKTVDIYKKKIIIFET